MEARACERTSSRVPEPQMGISKGARSVRPQRQPTANFSICFFASLAPSQREIAAEENVPLPSYCTK